jgi:hypothetical protein
LVDTILTLNVVGFNMPRLDAYAFSIALSR